MRAAPALAPRLLTLAIALSACGATAPGGGPDPREARAVGTPTQALSLIPDPPVDSLEWFRG